jgi:hypothetical protein
MTLSNSMEVVGEITSQDTNRKTQDDAGGK